MRNQIIDDYEAFYEELWSEYISEKIVSTNYINRNQAFIDSITFDMFNLSLKANLPVNIIGKMLESYFFNLFRFKAGNENIPDDVVSFY